MPIYYIWHCMRSYNAISHIWHCVMSHCTKVKEECSSFQREEGQFLGKETQSGATKLVIIIIVK